MATKTMQIIRSLAGKEAVVFNDKLANSVRVIQVSNWTEAEYDAAKQVLEASGLKATKTMHYGHSSRGGANRKQIRLQVVE